MKKKKYLFFFFFCWLTTVVIVKGKQKKTKSLHTHECAIADAETSRASHQRSICTACRRSSSSYTASVVASA